MTRTTVFWGVSWFKFNNFGLPLGTNLKFYTSVEKRVKLKVRKFLGIILTFAEVTEEKLDRFKLNAFLNIETTTTLNSWSSVPMVVLVGLQFPRINFASSFGSPFLRHSYNAKTKFQITYECVNISKVCIEWTNVGKEQTKIISLM